MDLASRMMDTLVESMDHFDFLLPPSKKESLKGFETLLIRSRHPVEKFKNVGDLIFNAKLFVIDKVAAGSKASLEDLFVLFLYQTELPFVVASHGLRFAVHLDRQITRRKFQTSISLVEFVASWHLVPNYHQYPIRRIESIRCAACEACLIKLA